jgi:hypothetical protein
LVKINIKVRPVMAGTGNGVYRLPRREQHVTPFPYSPAHPRSHSVMRRSDRETDSISEIDGGAEEVWAAVPPRWEVD